jgi:hypothetical protein
MFHITSLLFDIPSLLQVEIVLCLCFESLATCPPKVIDSLVVARLQLGNLIQMDAFELGDLLRMLLVKGSDLVKVPRFDLFHLHEVARFQGRNLVVFLLQFGQALLVKLLKCMPVTGR